MTALPRSLLGLSLGLALAGQVAAQDHTVAFETEAVGEYKGLDLWGLDTAWLWDANVIRGVNFMGKPQTDLIRFSFTGDTEIVNGELTGSGLTEFNDRMAIVDTYTDAHTALYLNNDTENWNSNPYLTSGGVDPFRWAELIAVTARKAEQAGRTVISVAPFNEPDHGTWQGNVSRFGDVCWWLRWSGNFPEFSYSVPSSDFISIMGGNTLNNDNAAAWYNQLNTWGFVEEGNTHQLAGSFDNYAAFYQSIEANGDVATNDELHNVMEAMVGAQYGMDVGIWWGTAERARGEFVKTSDGMRLAYAEDRPRWTAASVYRAPSGKIQAFVGESERQAQVTTYRFFSKDRPVFYDGYGPQRSYDVTTTGGSGYQTANHKNAERVVNITWGEDVQPVIDGRYYLVNRASMQVMQIDQASLDDGANVGQGAFDASANQEWDVTPVPRDIGGDNSYFAVKNVNSGKAPEMSWSLQDGGNIFQWSTSAYPSAFQQYFLEYVEDGWFKLGSRWSGLYLAADGANVAQQSPSSQYSQQWRLVPVGSDPVDVSAPAAPSQVQSTANAASVTVQWQANAEADLASYTVLRSATAGGPYEIVARGLTSTTFTDNAANQAVPYHYVVQAEDESLNRSANSAETSATPSGAPALVAHYRFQGDATDDSGNENDATLEGAARYVAGGANGGCLVLDEGRFVSLPSEVASFDQITIAAWVHWNGGANWQRIFDFGNGTNEYMFLTPANWDGQTMQFTIYDDGVASELYAAAPSIGQWTHVAVTIGGGSIQLYVDGVLADSEASSLKPSDFDPVINYIGKSQYPDPTFNGAIDEFRIYNHALGVSEIASLASASLASPSYRRQVVLNNADFEAGVTNFPDGFDADPDVPGWTDHSISDAGVEGGAAWWGTYNGSYSAFMAPGNGAYLQSGYTIQNGDEFDIGFVAKSWSGASQWTATLFYDNPANVIGSYATNVTGSWVPYSSTIAATPASVGGKLGILFVNTGGSGQFANLDGVTITTGEDAPFIVATSTPTLLWPPNHEMRDVSIALNVFNDTIALGDLNVTCYIGSNEPDNGKGDGNTTGDVNGADGYTAPVPVALSYDGSQYVGAAQLRAERSGTGSGRVYTIVCVATNRTGESSVGSCEVTVPHG